MPTETPHKTSAATRVFNILNDPGVLFSVGNVAFFHAAGTIPQIVSVGSCGFSLIAKTYSEFKPDGYKILTDPDLPLKVVSSGLVPIGVSALWNGHYEAGIASLCFATGNFAAAGAINWVKPTLTNAFNKVSRKVGSIAAQIATEATTYYTIGLGMAAYMASGGTMVSLPFGADIPASLITYIPTAIGGSIAVRNAIVKGEEGQDHYKPLLWMAAGTGMTAAAGILDGEALVGFANAMCSGAYISMQAERDARRKKKMRESISSEGTDSPPTPAD